MSSKPTPGASWVAVITAIRRWQENRATTYTPSNILHDHGETIIASCAAMMFADQAAITQYETGLTPQQLREALEKATVTIEEAQARTLAVEAERVSLREQRDEYRRVMQRLIDTADEISAHGHLNWRALLQEKIVEARKSIASVEATS